MILLRRRSRAYSILMEEYSPLTAKIISLYIIARSIRLDTMTINSHALASRCIVIESNNNKWILMCCKQLLAVLLLSQKTIQMNRRVYLVCRLCFFNSELKHVLIGSSLRCLQPQVYLVLPAQLTQ
jgi:hypothetical protein